MKARVMAKAGVTVRAQGMMYKAVAQSVLIYVRKIWVVIGETLKVLEGFHHRSAREISGMTATHGAGRECEYPPLVATMEATGFHSIREYIMSR